MHAGARSSRLLLLVTVLGLAGCGDDFVEVGDLRCRTPQVRNVAVDLQVPQASPDLARDQAIQSAGLPRDGWALVRSDEATAELRRSVDGRPVARIDLAHVTTASGYPVDGWTVSGVTECADPS